MVLTGNGPADIGKRVGALADNDRHMHPAGDIAGRDETANAAAWRVHHQKVLDTIFLHGCQHVTYSGRGKNIVLDSL